MKRILLLSMVFSFVFVFSAWAQRTVSGKVTDESGEGLPGVNVVIKGTTTGVTTDLDGNYSISVPDENTVLVFSSVGMATQEVTVGARSVIDLGMSVDATELSEVVITGSAPGITSRTVGYSVGQVDEDLIQNAPGVDPAAAIQGKVAGVRVVQSGAPGASADIRLRGTTSLYEGQNPLIIVDGVIIDGGLNTINSEDIESVQILKSASAAALYGSRAANGAVVIQTRRGDKLKAGTVQVTVRNEVGTNFLPGRIDLAETHHYEIDEDTGAPPFGNQIPREDQLSITPYPGAQDFQDILFEKNAFYTNYVSFSGNNDKSNFLVSVQNTRQPGVLQSVGGSERLNFKANFDYQLTKDLRLSTSNFFSSQRIDVAPNGPFFDALLFRPDVDLFEKVPNPNNPAEEIINAKPDSTQQMVNPIYTLNERYQTSWRDRYIGSLGFFYTPVNWLTFEGFVGLDKDFLRGESVVPLGYLADDVAFARIQVGGMDISRSQSTQANYRASLLITQKFGDIDFNARLGYWYDTNVTEFFSASGDGFVFGNSPVFDNISDPEPTVSSSGTEVQQESGFIQVGGVYKDKLTLDLLGRRDAVSLFGPESRSYNNYRVAASYILTEDFDIPNVQLLKVRASRATSGVVPRFSAQYETFNLVAGVALKNQAGNSQIKPANSIENEFGINANFLNRFTLDVTYVINQTEDQIISVPLPSVAGYNSQWQNAGTLEYNGIEITLGANILNTDNFRWDANLVFDRFRQEITDLPIPEFRRGTGIQQSDVFLIKEGEPIGAIYATKWMRSLNEVLIGDPTADLNDYAINDEGYVVRADQIGTAAEVPLPFVDADGNTIHKVGDTNADFNLGFNSTLTFQKNLQLYFLLDWKQGGDIYSQTLQFLTRDNRAGYMDQRGDATPKPIGYYQAFYNTNNPSSYFVYDGSYLKLRELSLRYNVPTEKLGMDFIKGIQVGVVGRNLWIMSDYPGYDPEVGQGGGNIDRTTYAVDGFRYPNFRTFSASLQLTF